MGTSRRRASASASGPHGYQSTGLCACCCRYGEASCARRFEGRAGPGSLMVAQFKHARLGLTSGGAVDDACDTQSGVMRAKSTSPAVAKAQRTMLEGVGVEVAASFPGITRLGGQIVAALYLADGPRSMDELSVELGRSKSNIFANLRGLEAAGIIERRRETGARHDSYTLRGKYPDVVIGAY